MALPTLDKNWNFSVNNIYNSGADLKDNYRDLWFGIVDYFISNGWTVPSSCRFNSGSSYTASTGNLWASKANLEWSNSGGRSWIVLKHPNNICDIAIELTTHPSLGSASYPGQCLIYLSRGGYNTTGLSTSAIPTPVITGDSQTILSGIQNNTSYGFAWGGTNQRFVRHSMNSTDGYSFRHIIYCQDYPVFGMFIEAPKEPVSPWAPSKASPVTVMNFFAASVANSIGTGAYTNASLLTRIGTDGFNAANVSLYLSGESYSTNLLTNGLNVPNDFTGEYPMVPMGIISTTGPFRGKLGKMSDLWFGISNFLGPVAYPGDSSRQFAQHGTIITPWNGSNIVTR